ncbi:MAG: YqgE/AlgH family protein [Betaproteobacteria bacterium]|nr:YqgE/AlgH family protein [Betaproteobacteria bacterium]
METHINLTHHFLIAMPNMADPNFSKTLTYVCEHNERGALGVVVNRPVDLTLKALFSQIDLDLHDDSLGARPVYFGGPVQVDRGFVLHRPAGDWQSTLVVAEDVALTTSRDILQAVSSGGGPSDLLVTLGYAGWAPGQLEEEIRQNAWLTVAAVADLMFSVDASDRWAAAMGLLGVNLATLSDEAGHA